MRNTLEKNEILKGYSAFNNIFKDGKSISRGKIRIVYQVLEKNSDFFIKVGFTVSRGTKNKIIRNRAKRILREFYRLNKSKIYFTILNSNVSLNMILIFNSKSLNLHNFSYSFLKEDLEFLFNKLVNIIESF